MKKEKQFGSRGICYCLHWMLLMTALPAMVGGQGPTSAPAPKGATPPAAAATPPAKTAAPPTATAKAPAPAATATPPTKAAAPPPTKATPPAAATPPTTPPTAAPPVKAAAPPPNSTLVSPPTPAPKAKAPAPAPPPKKPPPPAPAPAPLPSSPVPAPAPAEDQSDLDPAQVAALISLHVSFNRSNPCATSSDILLCDDPDSIPRHVISLSLQKCPTTARLTTTALYNLSTVKQLEFLSCPMKPVHVPSILVSNLTTFICSQSLGKTGINEKADKLQGSWLARLTNLADITVTDVEVASDGLDKITVALKKVTHLTIARVNMGGLLPRNTWPPDVELIDVSGNSIRGTIPSQMGKLSQLKHLDLSDNQIKGVVPNIFEQLSNLQYIDLSSNQLSGPIPGSLTKLRNCSYLDLHGNKLNGSVLANISSMRTLRRLDLSDNELTGPIPFNTTFLNRLLAFKISGNSGVCYNHTSLKHKFLTGIPNCPTLADEIFAPSPAPSAPDVSSSGGGGSRLSKGAAAGISVVAIVGAAVLFVVVRKWWKNREDPDQFVNLRRQ